MTRSFLALRLKLLFPSPDLWNYQRDVERFKVVVGNSMVDVSSFLGITMEMPPKFCGPVEAYNEWGGKKLTYSLQEGTFGFIL